jgi:hypothetical protein
MTPDFRRLYAQIERPAPPAGLLEGVLGRIAQERKAKALKRRLAWMALATLALSALLAWSFTAVSNAMAGSGNLQFLSLVFSDTQVVLSNGSAFAYSVLESLPAGRMAAFLVVALCFALMLRAFIRDARQAFGGHHAFIS